MWALVEILWIYSELPWPVGEPGRLISTCSCHLSCKWLSGCGFVLVALHACGNGLELFVVWSWSLCVGLLSVGPVVVHMHL